MMDLRLPFITGQTTEQRISQLQSYLYQLVEQLNFALSEFQQVNDALAEEIKNSSKNEVNTDKSENTVVANFNEIKSLIIKSQDIVNAYYSKMKPKNDAIYTSLSAFGTFRNTIEDKLAVQDSYIRYGVLYYEIDDTPVYGVELCHRDAEGNYIPYVRFVNDNVLFFDSMGNKTNSIEYGTFKTDSIEITGAELKLVKDINDLINLPDGVTSGKAILLVDDPYIVLLISNDGRLFTGYRNSSTSQIIWNEK